MFSVYSTSAVGILGAIVRTTDVEGILQLDCNATDFYATKPWPVFLMYNPHDQAREVTYQLDSDCRCDLLDAVSGEYLAKGVKRSCKITIEADSAALIAELPAGTIANDNTILYNEK